MAGQEIADLGAAVEAVAAVDVHALADAALVGGLEQLFVLEARLRAVQTAWLAAAQARDATVAECGRSPRSWLVEELHLGPADAGRRMRLARELPCHPALAAAHAAAEITSEHATVILAALPTIPVRMRDVVETTLLDLAREHPPYLVARAVDQVLATLGLDDDTDAAYARRYAQRGVELVETFGGTGSLSGTLSAEGLEKLRLALASADAPGGCEDERTRAQRLHDGLVGIAEFYLAHAELADSSGERPRVVVTISADALLDRLSTEWAMLDSGAAVAPETARRLACDAEILPAVLGSRGEVLDLGRATRSFSAAIRRAARLRDGGRCAFPSCTRRVAELHHVVWWSRGGPTSLDNAAWLCAFHHWLVHEGRWSMRRERDSTVTFTGPDGRQRSSPRRPAPGARAPADRVTA